jgi:hypothetical protein
MRKILKSSPKRLPTHYLRFAPRRGHGRRSALLERLLARADPAAAVADWRADAFRVIAPDAPRLPDPAPCVFYAERGPLAAGSIFIATPVHYVAEMTRITLPNDGVLLLNQWQADALAADFNRVWDGAGIRLLAGRRANLFCVFDAAIDAATTDPEHVPGGRIENRLPDGADAPRLRQLMSEMEMWLFEHPVNRPRAAEPQPAVNGLWLWGGGAPLDRLPPVEGWTAGSDPYFSAFAGRPEFSAGVSGVMASAATPGSDEWHEVESAWLERSVHALRRGEIEKLALSCGARCATLTPRASFRFWRRRRAWWEFFE